MLVAQLLIVEDDAGLRDVLVRTFRAEGLGARGVATGADALAHVAAHGTPDALVIDIGLPDADGRDLCQAIRARGVLAPVLFLTARHALTDRLSGFHAGGDDYVTKPFDIEEIVVRLRALLRRTAGEPGDVPELGFALDPAEHTVSRGTTTQALTPTEFRLLAALAGRPGKALARGELIGAAWPHGAIVQDNTLDVYIARIRRKLGALPDGPTIVTQHGVGYRLVLTESS
ncbi:MAG: response regulator transcription factor [Solirubrobacteraceae bacterium]